MIELLPPVRMLASTLLHSLWQCAAIGAIAWLALRSLRNATAQSRYAVSCAALTACVAWPAVQLVRNLFTPASTLAGAQTVPIADPPTGEWLGTPLLKDSGIPLDALSPWMVGIWAAGVGLMLLRLGAGLYWVSRLRRCAMDAEDSEWHLRLDRLARRLHLDRIGLGLLEGDSGRLVSGPLVIGVWRPMVLIPASLLARMPVDMLEALLAHELAHIRRHDYLANLLQRAAEALLFYHPVVWWLSRRIRLEREFVADDLAADAIGASRDLALALAELERLSHPVPSLAQTAHGGHLMSRIQSLLHPERRASAGVALLPIAGLALACIGCLAYAQSVQTRSIAAVVPQVTVGTPTAAGTATSTAASTASAIPARHGTYAIVDGESDRLSISGEIDDVDAIRAAQTHVDGDFLWFRRDGQAYVLRDPATLERVRSAWASGAKRDAEMETLSAQIQARADEVEAIGRRIEAAAPQYRETPEMERAMRDLHALADRQVAVAQQQATLATAMATDGVDDTSMAEAESRMDALDAQMEKLSEEMGTLESVIEAETAKLEADLQPLDAMEDEIEAATAPLEALGAKMETLGEAQEREMAAIDRKIRGIIDEAMAKGLASTAIDGSRSR